eukprot:TCONS_00053740-protein
MDTSSLSSSNSYMNYYDMVTYDSSINMDTYSDETSVNTDDFYHDNHSTVTTNDSYYGGEFDNFSLDSRCFYEDTDFSSTEGSRAGSITTMSRSTPDSSLHSSSMGLNKGSLNVIQRIPRKQSRGILKTKNGSFQNDNNNNINVNRNSQSADEGTTITHETLEKLRETELEDVLQYARDIINPDPKAKITFCTQSAKVVEGSFKHMLSIKELSSKTGAFKYRTIDILRNTDEEIGISLRRGDGWEKGEGIYVSRISLGSIFDQFEILRVGDEIVQVNKVDVKKMSVDDVIRLMHIPEKLSVTVKMLTPFSKKRLDRSGIEELKKNRYLSHSTGHLNNQRKFLPPTVSSRSNECLSKVAHLQIGDKRQFNLNNRHQQRTKQRSNTAMDTTNTNSTFSSLHSDFQRQRDSSQKAIKISPYRSMEGGKIASSGGGGRCLSPIHEFSNATTQMQRKQSYVRWFDES